MPRYTPSNGEALAWVLPITVNQKVKQMNVVEYVTNELPKRRKLDKQLEFLGLVTTGVVAEDKSKLANHYLTNHKGEFFSVHQAGQEVQLSDSSDPKGLCAVKCLAPTSGKLTMVDANGNPVSSVEVMTASKAISYLEQSFEYKKLWYNGGINQANNQSFMNIETIVKPEVLTATHDHSQAYAALPWDAIKPEFLDMLKAVNPSATVSPVIANYESGYIKRVLPSQVASVKGEPTLLWGGFSNRSEWLPLGINTEYGIEEVDKKATLVAYVQGVDFPVLKDNELKSLSLRGVTERLAKITDDKSFAPTHKLSELTPGNYPVTAHKVIETKFGKKHIITLGDSGDFWSNTFLNKRLSLGINPVNKTLVVKESYKSSTGNMVADCLLVD